MVNGRELWACAHHMIREHGEDAGLRAAARADALLGEADLAGHRTWLAILRKIERLQAPTGTLH